MIKKLFSGLLDILFPRVCPGCSMLLAEREKVICTECMYLLPRTNYWNENDNPIARIFWGRIQIENATSFLFFNKGSRLQQIIHHLKYKNQQEIGIELGKMFGLELQKTAFSTIDSIVPVPLHPNKLKKRGYNQSELITKGIAEVLNKPLITNAVIRISEKESQTHKSRFERWENVQSIFNCIKPEEFINKHILLVDDVLTTGATLESCASAILGIEGAKLSIATLAYAVK